MRLLSRLFLGIGGKASALTTRLRCLIHGISAGSNVLFFGKVKVNKSPRSLIVLGRGTILNASNHRNSLEARGPIILKTIFPGSVIIIGEDTGITSATISAALRVEIGRRVLVGAGALITDSDHHYVRDAPGKSRRHSGIPRPREKDGVVIGDDVFIGARSIILKGVHLGPNCVVAAGAVVTKSFGSDSVIAGNPAVLVGQLRRTDHS
jgi:acetyltransferase-like isoleucine patch superfamily enzyme